MKNKIRIIFCGTAGIADPILKALAQDDRFEVALVITQEDRPAGRKMLMTPPPVKKTAEQMKLPIFQPDRINDKASIETIKKHRPDVMVVMAYGQILKPDVLDIPQKGCINVHASLLPKYRGASPIQSALLAEESKTGISIMHMTEKMDAGPVYATFEQSIARKDDARTLNDKLAELAAKKGPDTLYQIANGQLKAAPQDESKATYCPKITKTDGEINWQETATAIAAKMRAYAGWPGTYTFWNGRRLKLLKATVCSKSYDREPGIVFQEDSTVLIATGSGALCQHELQLEGKNPQSPDDFIRGYPDFINSRLSSNP